MNYINVFGFNVFSDDLNKIDLKTEKTLILNTISPNSYGISTKDSFFREALINSDFLVLDGVYFALSSILLKGQNIKKNQGPDVFFHFMKRINEMNGKVFFLGSTVETLNKIKNRVFIEYPNIEIQVYSPPFAETFTNFENQRILTLINDFNPDILFIGMTCPRQEKWSYMNKKQINSKLVCSIGAVFDWYAGNEKNIHPIWWKLRLAWLKRTIDRPEILRRYPNILIFFKDLLLSLLSFKSSNHG